MLKDSSTATELMDLSAIKACMTDPMVRVFNQRGKKMVTRVMPSVQIFSSCANFLGLYANVCTFLQIFAQFCAFLQHLPCFAIFAKILHVFVHFLLVFLMLMFLTQSCVSAFFELFATLCSISCTNVV